MRPLEGRCHLGLAQVYRRSGRRSEADAHLRAAIARFSELDMPRWLERATEAVLG